MICITPDQFKTVPWKNGKGITQQIISSGDKDDYDWRFSRADVSVDGPFSIFDGKSRILTVIEGAGISLISNNFNIQAAPFKPVSFSGDVEIQGKLRDGPIIDLNLIYSTKRINASARVVQDENEWQLQPGESRIFAMYCLSGITCDESGMQLNPGDFGIVKNTPSTISIDGNGCMLFYTLDYIV